MAIGIALLLGFRFPINFDSPYKSASITEFWRRWHITLSTWLRDYLYISLGGSRHGTVRTYLNLIITMLLGGLWHGAAMRFVLWGALHGVALALHKVWLNINPWAKRQGADMEPIPRLLGMIFTFHIVCLGWLLFRAEDMQTVHLMLYQIAHSFNTAIIPQVIFGYKEVVALIVLGYFMHFIPEKIDKDLQHTVGNASLWWQVAMFVVVAWCVMQIKSSSIQPFIYFQF
jgi:D-alanyl-lipoteichoic acid acyltransferase DltB (MBOAT superfamily)